MAALRKSVEPIGTGETDTAFKAKVSDRIYVLSNVSGRLCVVTLISFLHPYFLISILFVPYKPALILVSVLANNNMITKISTVDIIVNNDDNKNYLHLVIIAISSNRSNLNLCYASPLLLHSILPSHIF